MTAKSISINGTKRKSGSRASKTTELTSGDLPRVVESRLNVSRGTLTARQKSAEGIVVQGYSFDRVLMRRRPERSGL